MAATDEKLPEGADAIIDDAAVEQADDDLDTADESEAEDGGGDDGDAEVSLDPAPELVAAANPAPGDDPDPEPAGKADAGGDTGSEPLTSQSAFAQVTGKATELRGQAYDRVLGVAQQGKDRAAEALENVTRLVDEAAGTIDEKVGTQYGDYARRAAEAVQGLASTLREKEVEALLDDAREAVRKSPAIAIGAAAALGFVIARLVKAGTASATEVEPEEEPARKTGGAKRKPQGAKAG